ncbi:Rpn family recombination-promoting nuclease/putative transposase [Floridanema aerugineum]|uniref:Rpn family recombination-promoting nuclease/putative transposase n=1 Tax=Floridaenema aerugineum BLCC-F46 TaxID=3153654 RepID=A0ABV4X3U8_9CYAN
MASDNICKYLTEKYPAQFVRWLLNKEPQNIQVQKTELSVEPIRADSLILLQIDEQILHLEFQTLPYSQPPLPFRMLQYWVRLQAQFWGKEIVQVVIFLKEIASDAVFTDSYQSTNISHQYRVIRLWEQDAAPFLADPGLLPLASLTRSNEPNILLEQVASQIARIEEIEQRRNISACAEVLPGLRFNQALIRQLIKGEFMRESVIYQEILQEGVQQGKKQGELALIMRQLNRRFGSVDPQLQESLENLSISQLEELGELLLDFSTISQLTDWLERQE